MSVHVCLCVCVSVCVFDASGGGGSGGGGGGQAPSVQRRWHAAAATEAAGRHAALNETSSDLQMVNGIMHKCIGHKLAGAY